MNLSVIFSNLIGFDGIIILWGVLNGFLAYQLKNQTNLLYEELNPTVYMPIDKVLLKVHKDKTIDLHYIRQLKEKETKLVHLFTSISNIFPLLGILGTIISLIRLVTFSGSEIIVNFTTALTSTFWGLVGAIIFKAIGGVINSRIETNHEMITILFNRMDTFEYEALINKNE
ncbi:MAG: MotA/TolQ/ExbB proton channel family protein [Vallitaleaceae bacterium]|jgi:biopolymer transport protein ExbB|nr:MotA/TolQ/ExbB proton channel family protein [Vallitaleaceae bacterium]